MTDFSQEEVQVGFCVNMAGHVQTAARKGALRSGPAHILDAMPPERALYLSPCVAAAKVTLAEWSQLDSCSGEERSEAARRMAMRAIMARTITWQADGPLAWVAKFNDRLEASMAAAQNKPRSHRQNRILVVRAQQVGQPPYRWGAGDTRSVSMVFIEYETLDEAMFAAEMSLPPDARAGWLVRGGEQ